MTLHHFTPTHYFNTHGSHEPVLRIQPGDSVVTTTVDARGQDASGAKVAVGPNPQTGPFYVESAEPGDILVVHLDRLTPNRETGWSSRMLAENSIDPWYVPSLPFEVDREVVIWRVDTAAGTASLVEPEGRLDHFTLPIAPMLGCFGVAPYGNQAISAMTSAEHGGNMDYRGFVAGVTAYFPVFVPGALFSLGDGHALQGDGEMSGSGVEISFEAQFTVDVLKGKRAGWPRGENADYIFTLGNARPLDQAVQHATTEMLKWLQADYGLTMREANLLMGCCVEYDLGNMYDPAYTMVCKIAKRFLPA
ncbi:MAG: acetamidase/formamidase family protein [Chloroflexi bacterium]|nr:acetamidase/formamidase family protein [Chloroflexota bacterium]